MIWYEVQSRKKFLLWGKRYYRVRQGHVNASSSIVCDDGYEAVSEWTTSKADAENKCAKLNKDWSTAQAALARSLGHV